jgi:hypothetical protein
VFGKDACRHITLGLRPDKTLSLKCMPAGAVCAYNVHMIHDVPGGLYVNCGTPL